MLKRTLFAAILLNTSVSYAAPNAPAPATATTTTTTTVTAPAPALAPMQTAPVAPTGPSSWSPSPTQPADMAGAYRSISVTDPGVQAAADFAVQQLSQGDLVKIVSAQVQVVAGKNYSLTLILSQSGVTSQYSVTVFVPLDGAGQNMQLTNVEAYGETDNNGDAGQMQNTN